MLSGEKIGVYSVAYGDFYSGGAKYKLNDYVTKEIKEFPSIFIFNNYHY